MVDSGPKRNLEQIFGHRAPKEVSWTESLAWVAKAAGTVSLVDLVEKALSARCNMYKDGSTTQRVMTE
jgi:hypothetical protein